MDKSSEDKDAQGWEYRMSRERIRHRQSEQLFTDIDCSRMEADIGYGCGGTDPRGDQERFVQWKGKNAVAFAIKSSYTENKMNTN